jgi:hypothetical protein
MSKGRAGNELPEENNYKNNLKKGPKALSRTKLGAGPYYTHMPDAHSPRKLYVPNRYTPSPLRGAGGNRRRKSYGGKKRSKKGSPKKGPLPDVPRTGPIPASVFLPILQSDDQRAWGRLRINDLDFGTLPRPELGGVVYARFHNGRCYRATVVSGDYHPPENEGEEGEYRYTVRLTTCVEDFPICDSYKNDEK